MSKTPMKKWLIMKSRSEVLGEAKEKTLQVYGDKFLDLDYAANLVTWLNRFGTDGWHYWLKEIMD